MTRLRVGEMFDWPGLKERPCEPSRLGDYPGGQNDIVHLVSSVRTAIGFSQHWAFTDRHADLDYAIYFDDLSHLTAVSWDVMPLQYWADRQLTKEQRQAEFLVHRQLPWPAIERIGVRTEATADKLRSLLGELGPPVDVRPEWYY